MEHDYFFEGNLLVTTVPDDILDRLAGLAIAYKTVSRAKVVKAAREQEGYIKGFLYGLEVGNVIDADQSEELLSFFMGQ